MQRVVDFGDLDKIEAVLAGGQSERHFQPHQNDQPRLWAAGQRAAWWFNTVKAEANAVARAVFVPWVFVVARFEPLCSGREQAVFC